MTSLPQPKLSAKATMTTDVSNAVCGNTSTGGLWGIEKQTIHINCLKLKALLLGLRSLCCTFTEKRILVQSDNTTAVPYINAIRVLNQCHVTICILLYGNGV